MKYFGGPGSDSPIDEHSMERSCDYDERHVSRQGVCPEQCYCFAFTTVNDRKLHQYEIGASCTCLLYSFLVCRGFNSIVSGLLQAEHQQFSSVSIVINDQDLADPETLVIMPKAKGEHACSL